MFLDFEFLPLTEEKQQRGDVLFNRYIIYEGPSFKINSIAYINLISGQHCQLCQRFAQKINVQCDICQHVGFNNEVVLKSNDENKIEKCSLPIGIFSGKKKNLLNITEAFKFVCFANNGLAHDLYLLNDCTFLKCMLWENISTQYWLISALFQINLINGMYLLK